MLATTAPIQVPCAVEGLYLARRTLRDPLATPQAQSLAADTLARSTEWSDVDLVRRYLEHSRAIQRQHDAQRKLAALSLAVPHETAAPRVPKAKRSNLDLFALAASLLIATALWSAAVVTVSAGAAQVAEWRAVR